MDLPRFSVRNPVAANLLMMVIAVGGLYCWFTLLREFFPNIQPDKAVITIPYPGATPEEVEKTVTRQVEQALKKEQDIEKISSTVVEGASITTVTFEKNARADKLLSDIQNAIDEIKPDLPQGVEEPEVIEVRPFIPVIVVMVYGDVSEEKLREEAKKIRDDLLELPEISEIVVAGIREREIWIEIRPEKLEEFGLTHEQVGRIVAAGNIDMPGGNLQGSLGNIRVRTLGEKEAIAELEELPVRTSPDGGVTRLKDIATVRPTFEDRVEKGQFGGKRAVSLTIFKAPEQDALRISDRVKRYVRDNPERLGGAVELRATTDLSRFIAQRLDLMLRNARMGFALVVLCLAIFLDLQVALWVSAGMVISFLGTFIVMQITGISINLITLFGLIVVLGLLVDDAIVVGENVYSHMRKGFPLSQSAIDGSNQVAMPVLGAVLTTVAAFLPLAFLEGQLGDFMKDLPLVVSAALGISIMEAFLILPAHLAHRWQSPVQKLCPGIYRYAQRIGDFRDRFFEETMPNYFEKFLRLTLDWRYVAIAAAAAFSIVVLGLLAGGVIQFVLIQKVDAEHLDIYLEMSAGTSEEATAAVISRVEGLALNFPELSTIFSIQGTAFSEEGRTAVADPATLGQISMEMRPADEREKEGLRTCDEIVQEMRRKTAAIAGLKKLSFIVRSGGMTSADIEILVRGKDLAVVSSAVAFIRQNIQSYQGVTAVEDDLALGKSEVRFRLRDSARSLGLTTQDLALQVRHALFGFEAQKLQGEDEEITVRVLLPKKARENLSDLSRLRIATPSGARVPLEEVAQLSTDRGYASLSRVDGKRAVMVRAQVDEAVANVSEITEDLSRRLAGTESRFPGVSLSFEGRKKETMESLGSLAVSFPVALLLIYSIIAILFRSYVQPLIVMLAIPYSMVGAIIGHILMGYPLTFLSLIGGVALAGIVVNDSLILVDFINELRSRGVDMAEAVVAGAKSRLRAILLTSITTVASLAPLMLEQSFQAKFLIPMAISLVFGLTLATGLTLVLIPGLYLVLEDVKRCLRYLFS